MPVICVGNYSLGGAGKTPTAIALVRLLQARGRDAGGAEPRLWRPAQRSAARRSGRGTRAADVGDEPLLLARVAPVIVSGDRVAGAAAAREAGASVIVMDDGFQNPSLRKDLSLIVVDGGRGIGNGRVFPAGPLRAPLAAQVGRTDVLVIAGEAPPPAISPVEVRGKGGLVLKSAHRCRCA